MPAPVTGVYNATSATIPHILPCDMGVPHGLRVIQLCRNGTAAPDVPDAWKIDFRRTRDAPYAVDERQLLQATHPQKAHTTRRKIRMFIISSSTRPDGCIDSSRSADASLPLTPFETTTVTLLLERRGGVLSGRLRQRPRKWFGSLRLAPEARPSDNSSLRTESRGTRDARELVRRARAVHFWA